MNPTPIPAARLILRVALTAFASLRLIAPAAQTATSEPAGPPPKTHTLFMGANLSIYSKSGGLLPVRDIQNNAFVAFDADRRVVATAGDDQFKLKIDDTLKLTAARATIDKLAFERSYTPEHDPMTKFKENAQVSSYMASSTDTTDSALRGAQAGDGLAGGQLAWLKSVGAHQEVIAQAEALKAHTEGVLAWAEAANSNAQSQERMEVFSKVSGSSALTAELAAEQYDALNITFELSAPRPLEKPYMVIFMRYLANKDRPDSANVWVYGERLPAIDEHPRKILIRRGGFPPGYRIDSYHVHLYDAGTEIATNVARKQVALTTDEAFEYSVIDYIGSNRNQTKAPTKSLAFWPGDLTSRVIPDKLSRTLYAKVRKDGRAAGLFEDEKCTRPVDDAEIAALAPELRFLPGLEKGKAAEGILPFKLGRRTD